MLRKRHIGNDIVTIVFQDDDAPPFTPKSVRSHFQHVFIVVRVHNAKTEHTTYRCVHSAKTGYTTYRYAYNAHTTYGSP